MLIRLARFGGGFKNQDGHGGRQTTGAAGSRVKMKTAMRNFQFLWLLALTLPAAEPRTVALWLFDEQKEIYPSSLLNDGASGEHVLVLGRGGRLVDGRWGRALEAMAPEPLTMTGTSIRPDSESAKLFGLVPIQPAPGRRMQPLWWQNATFAAFTTTGEKHLRSGGFVNISESPLNLGDADWTMEFWLRPRTPSRDGVVYEAGAGPRGENDVRTRLVLAAGGREFIFENNGARLRVTTRLAPGRWQHVAFVYSHAERQLRHYVDGQPQPTPAPFAFRRFAAGPEAYLSIARDGLFEQPLDAAIDELRICEGRVYMAAFTPPGTHSLTYGNRLPVRPPAPGLPLLFPARDVVDLGARKHVFWDGALVDRAENVIYAPQPPKRMEKVADEVRGHLCLIEDHTGWLRLYYRGPDDVLLMMTSRDGVKWETPDTGLEHKGHRNVVINRPVGLGVVFEDPNATPEARYKYLSGTRRRAIFLYSSPDGVHFRPHETPALPFAAGSQSNVYWDDQRGLYVAHHRSDYGMTAGGATERRFVRTETPNLFEAWPFRRVTPELTREMAGRTPVQNAELDPWYLDNGPLSPGGFGLELPVAFGPDARDPVGTDIYVTKALKYPWAPDAYVAFPAVYFHYWEDGPPQRRVLGAPERGAGSGVVETQLAVSRDGLAWRRYPRPAYVPTQGKEVMLFVTFGLVRRGDEIWQFVGGHGGSGTGYHSPFGGKKPAPLYRYVQRLDGFAAAEGAYEGGVMVTKPLRFSGKRLELNIDTGAVGYAQVGLLDANGKAIPGYSADDCVYINGDHLRHTVEWLGQGTDLSRFAGQTVRLEIRLRGAKLYAMQFRND